MVIDSPVPRDRFGRRIAWTIAAGLLLLGIVGAAAWGWATRHAEAMADRAAGQTATAQAGLLAAELQKFRLLPVALAGYTEVRTVLTAGGGPATRDALALDRTLEMLATRTDASAIYLIDARGRTVAASNWRLPTSFVGHDYRVRPYFREAMSGGSAEMFGLGTVSKQPGLFIARRIDEGGRPLGVIVVKVAFDRIEALWARQPGVTIVTDRNDVIVMASDPAWRFRSLRPLDAPSRQAFRRSAQYGAASPPPLDLDNRGGTITASGGIRYRAAMLPTPLGRSRLHYFNDLAPARASAAASARAAVLAAAILIVILLALVTVTRERALAHTSARRDLEREVAERTSALHLANKQLVAESAERDRINRRFRAAREELAQANRLATLGQVTAGVAHEINQPTAAIQTFAANAREFLARGMADRAGQNLDTIGELTARIGAITAELRGFAARRTPTIGDVSLDETIDGVLLLIGDRLKAEGVALRRSGPEGVCVVADRVRLEQILVNLIQNACDALAGREAGVISIEVAAGDRVRISVADNGAGVDPGMIDALFTPFVTGKTEGLGLGLAIARDIARAFGGDLSLGRTSPDGSTFILSLRPA